MEIKTKKELMIELRNTVAYRMVEQEASISYWDEVRKHAKQNSPDQTNAMKAIITNRENHQKDTIFLHCIDQMIVKEKK